MSVTNPRRSAGDPAAPVPLRIAKEVPDVEVVVGRDHERRLLSGLVDSLSLGGGAVAIHGEPGMGKTSLLTFVADYARRRDVSVHLLRGIESEAELPFAAITDLLWPLQEHLTALPAIQREALKVRLALSAGPPHGPLAACAGTLGLLTAAADKRPLVVLVDDFQWVDSDSAQILQFVARRLAGERLAMVLAMRAEPAVPPPETGLPILSLSGLSAEECAQIASAMGVTITPRALTSLVKSTGGNPLAVVERLRPGQRAWTNEWCPDLQSRGLHKSLERSWGRLFDQLPAEARTAMFLVADDRDMGGRHMMMALETLGLSLSSLEPAERLGLVACTQWDWSATSAVEVTGAHTNPIGGQSFCIPCTCSGSRWLQPSWYLAAAAIGPDEEAAAALVASADEARQRNGLRASAHTLRRAAELTANPQLRAERLLQAAQDAHLAVDSSSAVTCCEEALSYWDDPSFVVDVQRVAGGALTWLGEPRRALELMSGAAAEARFHDPVRAAEILAEATGPAIMQGEVLRVRDLAERVERIWEDCPDAAVTATSTAVAMVAEAFSIAGDIDRAAIYLRRVKEFPASSNMTADLHGRAFYAQTLGWSERYSEAHHQLTNLLQAARRLGSPTVLAFALAIYAEIGWWSGHWTTAYADATEALQWATENGQPGLLAYGLSMLARLEAARGDREFCEAHIDQAQREVEPRGVGCVPIYGYSLGLAALGAGELTTPPIDFNERGIRLYVKALPIQTYSIAGDLAEVLARAGESDRCKQVVNWLSERAQATQLVYPYAAACRARGILAPSPVEAQHFFAASLAALDKSVSHLNKHAPSCVQGRRCAATAVPSLHVSPSRRPSYSSRVSAREHGRPAQGLS